MAGHAARRSGDATKAETFFERAREEARKQPYASSSRNDIQMARFDGAASAWVCPPGLNNDWGRLDVSDWRILYGFVGVGTRDPVAKPDAAVTWMPSIFAVGLKKPARDSADRNGTESARSARHSSRIEMQ